MKYAWFDGQTWHSETVSAEGLPTIPASGLDLAILPSGEPAIACTDFARLRYVWHEAGAWHAEELPWWLTSQPIFAPIRLALSPNGDPAVASSSLPDFYVATVSVARRRWGGWSAELVAWCETRGVPQPWFDLAVRRSGHAVLMYYQYPRIPGYNAFMDTELWPESAGWGAYGSGAALAFSLVALPYDKTGMVANMPDGYLWFWRGTPWQGTIVDTIGGYYEATVSDVILQPNGLPAIAYAVNGGLRVAVLIAPGDLNCDRRVDFQDISPFVLALSDPAGYTAAYPSCNISLADINGDGVVNFDDINPFVALLSQP